MFNWYRNFSVHTLDSIASWLVLAILLVYTVVSLVHAPYLGFDFNPSTGEIQEVFAPSDQLRAGDRIQQVEQIIFDEWQATFRLPLFDENMTSRAFLMQLSRGGTAFSLEWQSPGPTPAEIASRLIDAWGIGYIFWFAGLIALISLRPRSSTQRLFAYFCFLTAIWLVAGNVSRWNLWDASVVFRMAIWLAIPVYLHLHWNFPAPLRPLPPRLLWGVYLAAIAIAVLQWFEMVPKSAYGLAFVVALLGSFAFLLIHYFARPSARIPIRIILSSFAFAIVPVIVLSIAASVYVVPRLGGVALLALPMIPIGYSTALYRHKLGGIEVRTNRRITLFLFLIAAGTGLVLYSVAVALLPEVPGKFPLSILFGGLLSLVVALRAYAPFERVVEQRLLGMPLPPADLAGTFLERITTSHSRSSLVRPLRDEVIPSLLIRQSALVISTGKGEEVLYCQNVDEVAGAGQGIPAAGQTESRTAGEAISQASWVRLAIPLLFDNRRMGTWLLGKRDPDDFYSEKDMDVLRQIGQQTAIALVNIEQSERLQLLYQSDIERHEAERKGLAHSLHDEVLNQAAVLYNSLGRSSVPERFEAEYEALKQQVRRMISQLRPATLRWGLWAAFEEMVDDLDERYRDKPEVILTLPEDTNRYPEQVEEHCFRIVQQACENAVRHADASLIEVSGSLSAEALHVFVRDNGVGFETTSVDLSDFVERKHFGLAGMYERSEIIHADLEIESALGQGTTVHLHWREPSPAGTTVNP
ncbi:MAG: ATP-binding protein [Caldilineaceae bacterium]